MSNNLQRFVNKRCVTLVALPFTLKSILRQKKIYRNSNISPCKNTIFKKSFKRNQNPSRYYNSITNLKFQHKPKYHLSKILCIKNRPIIRQGPKAIKLLYSIMSLNTISLPWQAKPIKEHQPWIKENTYLGTIRIDFLCLSQAHVRKVAPDSRGTQNCWSTINFWTAGPGFGFRFFFYVVEFLHLAKKRKGEGRGGGCNFYKGCFGR